ncbi:hypothetical protein ARMGADRAFT_1017168 [Armillaria gallica]|uniref:Uncharacterized protein n=1 Tax=Armillaria gallica TaxID=47427 RepID=A0A2H3DEY5_ARMGA|nr:hypothetical protein ARMGADRAFT_1017168 [Armillaria gallica]
MMAAANWLGQSVGLLAVWDQYSMGEIPENRLTTRERETSTVFHRSETNFNGKQGS